MPEFTYTGDEGRTYSSLPAPANAPEVGETYTLRKDPGDGRWQKAKGSAKPHAHDPEPDPAPEPPATADDKES